MKNMIYLDTEMNELFSRDDLRRYFRENIDLRDEYGDDAAELWIDDISGKNGVCIEFTPAEFSDYLRELVDIYGDAVIDHLPTRGRI